MDPEKEWTKSSVVAGKESFTGPDLDLDLCSKRDPDPTMLETDKTKQASDIILYNNNSNF